MQYLIGIDEVGRGPIAGPVAVGVFLICEADRKAARKILSTLFRGVKESKQLSEKSREAWFGVVEAAQAAGKVDFAVIFQSEKAIDKNGISFCIKKCILDGLEKIVGMDKSADKISKRGFSPDFHPDNFLILLDGGLKAPAHFTNQKTIIRGDAKESVIALASICAKVLRDRYMVALAKKHPKYAKYGFDIHKGYGTKAHYSAIKKHGLSPVHRKSFTTRLAKNPYIG